MVILNLLVVVCAILLLFQESSIAYNTFSHGSIRNSNSWGSIAKFHSHSSLLRFRVADVDSKPVKTPPKIVKNTVTAPKPKTIQTAKSGNDDPFRLLQKFSVGLVPVAATLGFAVVPSQKMAFKAAGAAAGGIAGYFAKNSLDKRLEGIDSLPEFQQLNKDEVTEAEKDSIISDASFRDGFPKEVIVAVRATLRAREDLLTYTEEALEKIAFAKGVSEENLSLFFTVILSEAILRETAGKSLDLIELSAIVDFVEDVGFNKHEIGNAFGFAAIKIGKKLQVDDRGFFFEEFPVRNLIQSAKMFFLADKLIGNMEGFYGKRVSMMLNSFFLEESYQMVITQACQRLFGQCVQAVLASTASRISRKDVEELESFLGTSSRLSELRPANMQTLILEAVRGKLDADLKPFAKAAALEASLADYDVYNKARDIFGWDQNEMILTMDAKVMPVYEDIARVILKQVFEQPDVADEYEDVLVTKAQDLRLSTPKARKIVSEIIAEYNQAYVEKIEKVFAASGESLPAVYKIMVTHATVLEGFEKVAKGVMSTSPLPMPGLPFALPKRQLLYQYRKENISPSQQKVRAEKTLNELFELSDGEKQVVLQAISTPKIVSWVSKCISENTLHDNAKEAYRKMLRDYEITDESWQPTAADFFYQEVKKVAEARAIPSVEDMAYLAQVKAFLMVNDKSVHDIQLELLGDKYMKAVTEAMTPSGVIVEEYVAGLARLRARLGLSDEDGQILAAVAARNRFIPMLEGLVDIWKSNTDINYRMEKEKREREEDANFQENGEEDDTSTLSKSRRVRRNRLKKAGDPISSPDNIFGFMDVTADKGLSTAGEEERDEDTKNGPSNFMRETLNVIDMVSSNLAIHGIDLTLPETKPLVNAFSMVPEKDLIGILKYFIVARLTESNPALRQRYEQVEPVFIKILGISPASEQAVKQSVAYASFKSLLHNALLYKDSIEASDLQQYLRLKKALPLVDEVDADHIYMDARKHAVIDHASALFGKFLGNSTNSRTGKKYPVDPVLQSAFPQLKKKVITPADARQFRIQVSSMGLTMREVGFTATFLSLLFALEVQYAIEQLQQSPEELIELPDIYDIENQAAMNIIEASVKRYLSQVIALGLTAAKRFNEPVAIERMQEMLVYLSFISENVKIAADGNLFRTEDVERWVSFYCVELDDKISSMKEEIAQLQRTMENEERNKDEAKLSEDQEKLQKLQEQFHTLTAFNRRDFSQRITQLVYLTKSFEPPQQGIAGLMGNIRSDTSDDKIELDKARKKWSWD